MPQSLDSAEGEGLAALGRRLFNDGFEVMRRLGRLLRGSRRMTLGIVINGRVHRSGRSPRGPRSTAICGCRQREKGRQDVLSLNENPPVAYSGAANKPALESSDWTQRWVAVYTKPRQEKSLARDLQERRVTYFLPMVLRQTSSGGRRRKNLYPLFASYMFFAGDDAARLAVLRTERLVRVIDVDESQQEMFRRELASLELALRVAPESLELHPRVTPGTRVVIRSGPMAGVEGVVLDAGAKKKLWLGVSTLGVGATVEIHPDLVELA